MSHSEDGQSEYDRGMLGANVFAITSTTVYFHLHKTAFWCLIPKMVRVHKTGACWGLNLCYHHQCLLSLSQNCILMCYFQDGQSAYDRSMLGAKLLLKPPPMSTFTFTKQLCLIPKMIRVHKTGVCWGLNLCYHHHCLLSLSQNCAMMFYYQDGQSAYDRSMLGAQQGLSFVVWSSGPSCILCIA